MKSRLLKIFTLCSVILLASCNDKAKEAETKAADDKAVAEATATTFKVDPETSVIEWTGYKPTGSHNGIIKVAKGTVEVNDGSVESGNFAIDMSTIEVQDIPAEEEDNAKLKGHLQSPDFFNVEEYPMAKFEVTDITTEGDKTMLSGNLTLKDVTNNISFPVNVDFNEDQMMLNSETFSIDRSKWNVKYGSKSFFDDLGDKFIDDKIELKVSLKANEVAATY